MNSDPESLKISCFQFEGSDISIDSKVGIFITMNPGAVFFLTFNSQGEQTESLF